MRWNRISLCAILLSVASGQLLTNDSVANQSTINWTARPDGVTRDTSHDHRNTAEDSTREHSNTQETHESSVSSEANSSGENITISPPKSEESTHAPSAEYGSNQNPNSEDHSSNRPDSSDNPGSGEHVSGESSESRGAEDTSGDTSRGSRSGEPPSSNEEPSVIANDGKTVQTTHGPVKGTLWHNSDILGFVDIPYGKYNTPFEAPVTAQSWLDIHDLTQHTKVCPQIQNDEYIGDVNCLTLSIFTPQDKENASVLFHIHDNSANSISADPAIYGPEYLVPKGIILVLPNYRIGAMGFLCLQNETAPGNAGLKDLSLALEWVKENIHVFGGSPANVVVSGDGIAGAYASYLALYSRSKYYINKVITESGSALSPWALDRDPLSTAYELAQKIRNEQTDDTINYTFAEASLEQILRAAKDIRLNPCLELDKEPFMDSTPWEMLHGEEIDTTFMIGSAKYAGTHDAISINENYLTQLNNDFTQVLPNDLIFTNDEEKQEFATKLKKQYFGAENVSFNNVEQLSLWYTDSSYLNPAIRLARPLLEAGVTVYFYEFAFVGDLNRELESMNKPVHGAVRSDIVGYLFHKEGTDVEADTPEKDMISLMVDLWVSFIIYGKPTAENLHWNELKQVDASEEEWLLIDSVSELQKGLHVDRMQLWTEIYNEHFIEANAALRYKPHYYAPVVVLMMCWIANKFNYSSE